MDPSSTKYIGVDRLRAAILRDRRPDIERAFLLCSPFVQSRIPLLDVTQPMPCFAR